MKHIKMYQFKALLVIIALGLQSLAPSTYWNEYETARQTGKTKSLMEYISGLSDVTGIKGEKELFDRQSALSYFLATGGKYGFADRAATAEEEQILNKSLVFIAICHDIEREEQSFDILRVRRSYGKTFENEREKDHLLQAQKVLTATRMFIHGQEKNASDFISKLYFDEYVHFYETLNSTNPLFQSHNTSENFIKIINEELYEKCILQAKDITDLKTIFGPSNGYEAKRIKENFLTKKCCLQIHLSSITQIVKNEPNIKQESNCFRWPSYFEGEAKSYISKHSNLKSARNIGDKLIIFSHGGKFEYLMKWLSGEISGYALQKHNLLQNNTEYGIQVTPLFVLLDNCIQSLEHGMRGLGYATEYRYRLTSKDQESTPAILYGAIEARYLFAADLAYEAGLPDRFRKNIKHLYLQTEFENFNTEFPNGIKNLIQTFYPENIDNIDNHVKTAPYISKLLSLRQLQKNEFTELEKSGFSIYEYQKCKEKINYHAKFMEFAHNEKIGMKSTKDLTKEYINSAKQEIKRINTQHPFPDKFKNS